MICVFVRGEPKGQPRPRAFSRGGSARVYDPGTAEGWKGAVALELLPHLGKPMAGPIAVTLHFLMPRPKAMRRKRPHVEDGAIPHIAKPDLDNLEKAVLDACTQVGVWQDDCQVCRVVKSKQYHADKGGVPGLHLTIELLEGEALGACGPGLLTGGDGIL